MPLTENQLYDEAILLPNPSKIFLVEKLLENIGENIDRDTEAFQIREAKRRRDEIRSLQIQQTRGSEFQNSPTIEELANAQGVKPLQDITALFGTWPGEDDDGFEEEIRAIRI